MSDQLPLFTEPETNGKPKKGGSLPRGPVGLLKALQRQGLEPDTTGAAVRLVMLLDSEAAGRPAAGDGR